jgi:hypothetical protein
VGPSNPDRDDTLQSGEVIAMVPLSYMATAIGSPRRRQ